MTAATAQIPTGTMTRPVTGAMAAGPGTAASTAAGGEPITAGGVPVLDDAARWEAVVERRRGGGFVYAVASTRVYCRPDCPSRRPQRDRVRFFDRPADAERAGYRACLRCRPASSVAADLARVRTACARLAGEPATPLAALAREAGVTARQLQRDFRRLLGVTPSQYSAAVRAARFRRAVRDGGLSVTEAQYEAGYGSGRAVYEHGRRWLGMAPGRYARAGAAETVRYALAAHGGRWVLLAATSAGFCALTLGDDPDALVEDLRREFAAARVREAEPGELDPWLDLLAAYFEGRAASLEVPLDIAGTAFQMRVWECIRRIPPGETRTYGEIAAELGLAGARAVAGACARNPVALAVPCHRVVGARGIGGYRWGVETKRALLDRERAGGTAPGTAVPTAAEREEGPVR